MIIMTDGICSGEPRINGTRITVKNVLQQLANGMTIQGVCEDFDLGKDQVIAIVDFNAKLKGCLICI